MRLISCYIENFGGLSHYTCDFNSGITELREPNGFGKTTLAEFIRAMFYGFPRANKSIKKDKRKKYRPWQGGKCGGKLVFEYEGEQYRIERFFGDAPASDTFELYDMSTHRRSRKFSSNIGVELFQLDSDSFERSTYLPQLYVADSLTTDNIQAKLGDLVDDTNDINNYEKAITAIRTKRSSLIPYRGQDGQVRRTQKKISELEEMLCEIRNRKPKLEQLQRELSEKQTQLEIKEAAGKSVLEKISQASEAAGKKAITDRFDQMKKTYSQKRHEQDELQRKYPGGFPTTGEIDAVLQLYDASAPLKGQSTSATYDNAKRRLQENSSRFAEGIPTDDDFSAYRKRCQEYTDKKSLLQSLELSPDEQERLKELESFFSAGIPDEKFIEDCKEHQLNIRDKQAEASGQNLPLSQQTRLENLQQFFGGKAPSDNELSARQRELQKIERLKQENNGIASSVVAPVTADTSSHKKNAAFFPVLLFGIAAVVAGVILLTQQQFAFGGGLLGLGVILSVFAIYLRLKDMVSRKISEAGHSVPQMSEADRQRISDNETEIRRLEQSLNALLSEYDLTSSSISEKLSELQSKQREFLSLEKMKKSFDEKQTDIEKQIQLSRSRLEEHLFPYFGMEIPDDAHSILNWKSTEYKSLQNKRQNYNEESARLCDEIGLIEREIKAFLEPYMGQVKAEDFSSSLAALQQDCGEYIQNQKIVSDCETETAEREEKLSGYEKRISEFSRQYGLNLDIDSRRAVQTLRDNARDHFELIDLIADLKKEIEEFMEKNKDIIAAPKAEEQYDLDGLQAEKKRLDTEISDIAKSILETEQEIKNIRSDVDQIPQKEDELADLKAEYATGRQQADLLDDTINFLQQAKEQLSGSYLGTIRHSFSELLHRLTDEMNENILMDAQLDVKLERHGETLPIDYFSAGQLDIIMLCMRIALVEALFKDVKPFIILDDPFVNLDDEHTAAALALLQDLAKDYQIIYLVCNSSRALGTSMLKRRYTYGQI